MNDTPPPDQRRRYAAAFRAQAVRLADAQARVAGCFNHYHPDRLHPGLGRQTPYLAHQHLL